MKRVQEREKLFCGAAKVTARAMVGTAHCRLRLHVPRIARAACPGQFVHVHAMDHGTLRRPISIHRRPSDSEIEVLFKIVGEGTALLQRMQVGDVLDVLGPTGAGFRIPPKTESAILVGGGVGAAPLMFLWDRLQRRPMRSTFVLGALDRDALPIPVVETDAPFPSMPRCQGPFLELAGATRRGNRSLVMLEQANAGYRGLVTEGLKRILRAGPRAGRRPAVYACGPRAMMVAVAEIARKAGVPCQVSLEQRMGCGLGACMGCAVPIREGKTVVYKRACVDGPVFDAESLDWGSKW